MGNPSDYYVKALQYMSYALNCSKNKQRAREFSACTDIEKLELEIKSFKDNEEKLDKNEFIFLAGRTYERVSIEAEDDGNDGWNACAGGLHSFRKLTYLDEHNKK